MYLYFGIAIAVLVVGNIYAFYNQRNRWRRRLELCVNETTDAVLRSMPNMIFLVDGQYIIRRIINADAGQLSGEVESIIGQDLSKTVHPDSVDLVLGCINRALISGEVAETEYSMILSGEQRYFQGYYKRFSDKMVACFEQEITDKKKKDLELKQNELLLSSVLDNMPMPLMIKDIDDDLRYVFWNKQCDAYSGYNRSQILGRNDLDIYGAERGSHYQAIDRKVIESGTSYQAPEIFETSDSKKHYSIVNKNVVSNDFHHWLLVTRWETTELIEIQEQLREVNRQMKMAFQVTQAVPVVWNIPADRITLKFPEYKEGNSNFQTQTNGMTTKEVVACLHPDEQSSFEKMLEDLQTGIIETDHREIRFDVSRQFNTYFDLYLAIETRDASGKVERVIGTLRNITNEKQGERRLLEAKQNLEEMQEMNQLILDHTNNGLVFITPDFRVLWENVRKYSSHPMSQNYVTGQCCYKTLLHRDEPCEGCPAMLAMQSGRVEKKEYALEGDTYVEVTATSVLDKEQGSIRGVVLKYENVTAQRKVAKELKDAKEAAETSDRLKSLFLSNMSHEIRTPLNAIVGFSALMAMTEDPQEKEVYVSVITKNNELLLQLINDILDLSKIEANTLDFVYGEVELNELMQTLEISSRRKSLNPEVEIAWLPASEDCMIRTEKNRLLQLLSNLVGNAMKFTDHGYIHFGYETQEQGLRFFVKDTGRGIPQEQQSKVFDRFVKLDTFTNGTGLGLAICQHIVQRLGGEIGVYTNETGGCTFWFTLPVQPERCEEVA